MFSIFLVVEFEDFVFPSEIFIYETYNPGAIVKIWAFTMKEKWVCLWKDDGTDDSSIRLFSSDSHIFSPPIKEMKVATRIIRIEFNHRNLEYFTEIDGILLEGVKFTPRTDSKHHMKLSQVNQESKILRKLENVSFIAVPALNQNQNQDKLLKDFLMQDLENFIAKINCGDKRSLSPSVPEKEKNPYTLKNMPVCKLTNHNSSNCSACLIISCVFLAV